MRKTFFFACLISAASLSMQAAEDVRLVHRPSGGFMVLTEDNQVVATGSTDEMSAELRAFLVNQDLNIIDARSAEVDRIAMAKVVKDSIGPLLGDIMFDQYAPYNRMTPKTRKGERCLTGCVATAMSQIMTYHRWPTECNPGTVSYTTESLQLPVSFTYDGVTFNYDLILPKYTTKPSINYTEEQANEVAKLMAAAGAAVEMDYTTEGSGALSRVVPDAFVSRFKYKLGIKFEDKEDFANDEAFYTALRDEFAAGRPVYMSGADKQANGHAYVIDGYLTYEGAEQYPLFHFNWGWSGEGNEWLMIRNSTYNQTISIVRHIAPDNGQAVENVEAATMNGVIYNLLGQPVQQMTAGQIYIVNGHKYIAR